ncbi:MAG TPA: hypothetical protein VFH47_08835, partial [Candidatus Thermoplasmatota archaeon]|nr:hypothetical protein [Candidatus Thermoplasmatota archaeon]
MRPAAWWLLAGVAQLSLVVATAFPPFTRGTPADLGAQTWHHNASFLAALGFSITFAGRMAANRRFLGCGVLASTCLAAASAFLLLYLRQPLTARGLAGWAAWWHVAWSWFALSFFLGHTWVNRQGLLRSLRRLHRRWWGSAANTGLLAAVVAAALLAWRGWDAAAVSETRYVLLTLHTWLVLLVPAYGLWLVQLVRARLGLATPWLGQVRAQAFVSAWLVPVTALANVTGLYLLYAGADGAGMQALARYWHAWPAIALAVLAFAHTVQLWPEVRAYGRHPAPPALGGLATQAATPGPAPAKRERTADARPQRTPAARRE